MNPDNRTYIAIDLKSFYASVECVDRGLDPLTTNLVVADSRRTEKTTTNQALGERKEKRREKTATRRERRNERKIIHKKLHSRLYHKFFLSNRPILAGPDTGAVSD